jgi:hypothetical protein
MATRATSSSGCTPSPIWFASALVGSELELPSSLVSAEQPLGSAPATLGADPAVRSSPV